MRRPAAYPTPGYKDPNDIRLVQVIRASDRPLPSSVNILGIPFDGAVLGRRGAAEGPDAIRQSMSGFSTYNFELGEGLEDARIFDLGDVVMGTEGVVNAHSLVEAEINGALEKESLLVVIGGDNSISLPAMTSCSKKFGSLGLIVVDSHLDLRGEIGGRPTSGSSYGLAIENKIVSPTNVVEIGIHGFLNSRNYVERARELGIKLITSDEVRSKGASNVAADAYRLASKGTNAVYLSIDLDAIDLSQVSGVSAPSVGGLWAGDVCTIAYEIGACPLVECADLVELAPFLDPSGKSARVAATVLAYLAAGYHSRKKKIS